MSEIKNKLLNLNDIQFKEFNAKLIPNIDPNTVIGIKTPMLRNLAKEMIKDGSAEDFIKELPHEYFEENQLHSFIISEIKEFDIAIYELERFLPYVDNWATCDQLMLKAIAKEPERMLDKIDLWLESDETYTVRFAIGLLMRYFLDDRFDVKYLEKVASVKSDEYYINMMIAWYFATALAKQYEATLPYLAGRKLSTWVHNKTIQKARESRRVSNEHKEELNKLKVK